MLELRRETFTAYYSRDQLEHLEHQLAEFILSDVERQEICDTVVDAANMWEELTDRPLPDPLPMLIGVDAFSSDGLERILSEPPKQL